MQLFASPTSPYARKVRIVIAEKGLAGRVTILPANPLGDDTAALHAANPLGKIPTLVLDDGTSLYDSRVIVEYLDGFATSEALIPEGGIPRMRALRRQALADGVMDAAFSIVMERRRPAPQQSPEWLARWEAGIRRAVAAIETSPGFDIGDIATAAALGYLDFRLPDLRWRDHAPAGLAEWWGAIQTRNSILLTVPEA